MDMWFWVSEPLGIYAIGLFDFDGWDGVHRVKNNNNNILKFLRSEEHTSELQSPA